MMFEVKIRRLWKIFALITGILLPPLTVGAEINRVLPQSDQQLNAEIAGYYRQLNQADQILVIPLNSDPSRQIIALFQPYRLPEQSGGILILHDTGHSPDWPVIVHELRSYLPDTGWSTLTLPMTAHVSPKPPQRQFEPKPEEVQSLSVDEISAQQMERIELGVSQLRNRDIDNITLAAVGESAGWAARYIAGQEDQEEFRLVMITAKTPEIAPDPALTKTLAEVTVPILDIYFDEDKLAMKQAALRRGALNRAQHKDFTQVPESRLTPQFKSGPSRVTRRVWGWLVSQTEKTSN